MLHRPVEVGFQQTVFLFPELGEFLLRMGLRGIGGNFSRVSEDVAVVEGEKAFELGDPVLHGHGNPPFCLGLGEDEVLLHEVVEGAQLLLIQVVLGNAHIALADATAFPIREAHVRQTVICPGFDDFGGGLPVDGVMNLVLDSRKEALRQRSVLVVVDAGGVDVGDLLVKPALAGADVLDAAGQFLEVIVAHIRVLQPLVVQHEALGDVFLELVRRPLAETNRHRAAHPESQGQHHVEVVVCHLIRFAVGGSCSE